MADGLTPFQKTLAKKKAIRALPKYVRYRQTEMRLHNPEKGMFMWNEFNVEYFRDAGFWSTGFKVVDGKVFADDGVELIPITYKEWKKGNAGHISQSTKAYSI